ncbi:MAG: hypothetical protein LBC63_08320 [Holophagales bacterium]|jgi:hypothetical protein|nr:hypothetical protein [Holophagales bacterium]
MDIYGHRGTFKGWLRPSGALANWRLRFGWLGIIAGTDTKNVVCGLLRFSPSRHKQLGIVL